MSTNSTAYMHRWHVEKFLRLYARPTVVGELVEVFEGIENLEGEEKGMLDMLRKLEYDLSGPSGAEIKRDLGPLGPEVA